MRQLKIIMFLFFFSRFNDFKESFLKNYILILFEYHIMVKFFKYKIRFEFYS
jgi:hypothetical protein